MIIFQLIVEEHRALWTDHQNGTNFDVSGLE